MNCPSCSSTVTFKKELGLMFCSLDCLRSHVDNLKPEPKSKWYQQLMLIKCMLPAATSTHCTMSALLGKCFRSKMEADFAELACYEWGWDLVYEQFAINCRGGKKRAVPDFFVNDHGVLIEVKGLLGLGDRTDIADIQKIVGLDRMLVLTTDYASQLRSRALKLRRQYGLD